MTVTGTPPRNRSPENWNRKDVSLCVFSRLSARFLKSVRLHGLIGIPARSAGNFFFIHNALNQRSVTSSYRINRFYYFLNKLQLSRNILLSYTHDYPKQWIINSPYINRRAEFVWRSAIRRRRKNKLHSTTWNFWVTRSTGYVCLTVINPLLSPHIILWVQTLMSYRVSTDGHWIGQTLMDQLTKFPGMIVSCTITKNERIPLFP